MNSWKKAWRRDGEEIEVPIQTFTDVNPKSVCELGLKSSVCVYPQNKYVCRFKGPLHAVSEQQSVAEGKENQR